MKKYTKLLIIILVVIIVLTLYYFFYTHYAGMQLDGGTKVYEAKLYTLVHWGEMNPVWTMEDGTNLYGQGRQGWKIYWYPNQNIWKEEENPNYFPYDQYEEWLKNQKNK